MPKTSIALLACATALISTPALAANITYTGSQQLGVIAASYSFTTDGTIGQLTRNNVTDFSVLLSSGGTTFMLTPTNSEFATLTFNATAFSLDVTDPYGVDVSSYAEVDGFTAARLSFLPSGSSTQLAIGSRVRAASNRAANNISFASSVAPTVNNAVPEPATWAMMIAGFGLVGGAMRRRSTKIAFA